MPKGKNPYRAVHVNKIDAAKLSNEAPGDLVVAIDIAKKAMKAAVLNTDGRHYATVKWEHPVETPQFKAMLSGLSDSGVDVVAESTGTYGTALMESLRVAGHRPFMVSSKRSHDAAEVFDGVPSQHDSKDAHVLGMLHVNGCSRPWPERSTEQRDLDAQIRVMAATQERYQQLLNRLEALLAVYWPGVTNVLSLDRSTLWALVERFCWAGAVRKQEDLARRVMREAGRGWLKAERVEEVLVSARLADGVEPTREEQNELRTLTMSLRQEKKNLESQRTRLGQLGTCNPKVRAMATVLGSVTATVLFAQLGDPTSYESSGAYLKALGLNLRERSSGKHCGQLKITKRGPSQARRYLYFAALRLINSDVVVRAWYDRKVARDGGKKMKAVVAVMRKLMRAIPHVAKGQPFDATKLFDTGRLEFAKVA